MSRKIKGKLFQLGEVVCLKSTWDDGGYPKMTVTKVGTIITCKFWNDMANKFSIESFPPDALKRIEEKEEEDGSPLMA
jgi:uncharacterized protein YodC (DUF2158 family)